MALVRQNEAQAALNKTQKKGPRRAPFFTNDATQERALMA